MAWARSRAVLVAKRPFGPTCWAFMSCSACCAASYCLFTAEASSQRMLAADQRSLSSYLLDIQRSLSVVSKHGIWVEHRRRHLLPCASVRAWVRALMRRWVDARAHAHVCVWVCVCERVLANLCFSVTVVLRQFTFFRFFSHQGWPPGQGLPCNHIWYVLACAE